MRNPPPTPLIRGDFDIKNKTARGSMLNFARAILFFVYFIVPL